MGKYNLRDVMHGMQAGAAVGSVFDNHRTNRVTKANEDKMSQLKSLAHEYTTSGDAELGKQLAMAMNLDAGFFDMSDEDQVQALQTATKGGQPPMPHNPYEQYQRRLSQVNAAGRQTNFAPGMRSSWNKGLSDLRSNIQSGTMNWNVNQVNDARAIRNAYDTAMTSKKAEFDYAMSGDYKKLVEQDHANKLALLDSELRLKNKYAPTEKVDFNKLTNNVLETTRQIWNTHSGNPIKMHKEMVTYSRGVQGQSGAQYRVSYNNFVFDEVENEMRPIRKDDLDEQGKPIRPIYAMPVMVLDNLPQQPSPAASAKEWKRFIIKVQRTYKDKAPAIIQQIMQQELAQFNPQLYNELVNGKPETDIGKGNPVKDKQQRNASPSWFRRVLNFRNDPEAQARVSNAMMGTIKNVANGDWGPTNKAPTAQPQQQPFQKRVLSKLPLSY